MTAGIAATVLAGGRSSRMGGGDKTLTLLAGRPILAHVLETLRPQVETIAINANGDPARFAEFGLPVIGDTFPGYAGPLAGILAGMEWAARLPGITELATVAGDTPFFPADFIEGLRRERERLPGGIILATSSGRIHPTFALWPVELADDLRTFLASGERKVVDFIKRHKGARIDFPLAGTRDPFFNINTPRDLDDAGRMTPVQKQPEILGITGWKNSGKTTLTERLVTELVRRGYVVSTVKHAHHDFDIDQPGTDSFRHRAAGAREVAIVSNQRWALMHELRDEAEPPMEAVLARLSPCDIVLVEGYKREAHRKIEARRLGARNTTPLSADDPGIVAIAADHPVSGETAPVFGLDDIPAIADFVVVLCKLGKR